MTARTHLITGGTGLVGAALIVELLTKTTDRVVAVVRADNDSIARERLLAALRQATHDFGRSDLNDTLDDRVTAAVGDIVEPLCGLDLADLPTITHLWHCAASLRYEDAHAAQIQRLNVDGTSNVIDVAAGLGAQLNYISTCYVAGSRMGAQFEVLPTDTAVANNQYERSKIEAEMLVAATDLTWRILRPSVVVGHSETGAVLTYSGYYGFASALLAFRDHVKQWFGDGWNDGSLTFRADPDSELNLVPIDVVAAAAVSVGLHGAPRSVFALSNATALTMAEVVEVTFTWAGLPVPRLVDTRADMSEIDLMLDDAMRFYGNYFTHAKTFDQSNTRAVTGTHEVGARMDAGRLGELLTWWRARIDADGRTSFPAKTAFSYSTPRPTTTAPA